MDGKQIPKRRNQFTILYNSLRLPYAYASMPIPPLSLSLLQVYAVITKSFHLRNIVR